MQVNRSEIWKYVKASVAEYARDKVSPRQFNGFLNELASKPDVDPLFVPDTISYWPLYVNRYIDVIENIPRLNLGLSGQLFLIKLLSLVSYNTGEGNCMDVPLSNMGTSFEEIVRCCITRYKETKSLQYLAHAARLYEKQDGAPMINWSSTVRDLFSSPRSVSQEISDLFRNKEPMEAYKMLLAVISKLPYVTTEMFEEVWMKHYIVY